MDRDTLKTLLIDLADNLDGPDGPGNGALVLMAITEIEAMERLEDALTDVQSPGDLAAFDDERVVSLGLPFTVIHAGTDGAMFAELDSAYQRKAPIMLWIYAPHWAPAKYQGEWVEFPEYSAECYTDAAVGLNPNATHDCGKPFGEIWKVGWAGLKDKWPGAYEAIKAFTIDNATMGQLIVEVDLEGKTVEQAVADWMAANEATWSAWIQ